LNKIVKYSIIVGNIIFCLLKGYKLGIVVSVIMCAYNEELCIADAIKSILHQSYRDLEFIIVDDGSTDNTLRIINDYQKKDSRIRVISCTHQGIVKAVNLGLNYAKGIYIARMDADDISHVDRLKYEVEVLNNNPDIGVVSSQGIYIYNKKIMKFHKRPYRSEDIEISLISNNKIINSSSMFRKHLINKDGYNEKYYLMEDYYFWVSLIGITRFYTIPKSLIIRNKRTNSVTGNYFNQTDEVIKQTILIQKEAMKKNSVISTEDLYSFSAITRGMYTEKIDKRKALFVYKSLLKQIPMFRRNILFRDFYEKWIEYCANKKCYYPYGFSLIALLYKAYLKLYSIFNLNIVPFNEWIKEYS